MLYRFTAKHKTPQGIVESVFHGFDDEKELYISRFFVSEGELRLAIVHQDDLVFTTFNINHENKTLDEIVYHADLKKAYGNKIISLGQDWNIRALFRDKIFALKPQFAYLHEWEFFRKQLKSRLFTCEAQHWSKGMPKQVVSWFSNFMNKAKGDEGCVDNYRVAHVWNTSQKRRYKKQKQNGCCGFYDKVVLCPIDKKYYHVGFNYGH